MNRRRRRAFRGVTVSLVLLVAAVATGCSSGGGAAGAGAPAGTGAAAAGGAEPPSVDSGAEARTTPPQPVHPACSLTRADLEALVEMVPAAYREEIRARPQEFLALTRQLAAIPQDALARADKETRLAADYEPADLVSLASYGDRWILNREGLSLRALIIPDLAAMIEAARLDGVLLDISSSYRSYQYQEDLFAYWVDQLGREEAERVSARAGTSQHQLGTTVDFGSVTRAFADHPAGQWLAEHAGRFGFSLSYPDGAEAITGYAYEPWHFRWISRAGTRLEREFFGGYQQHLIEFWHEAGPRIREACAESR